MLMIKDGKKLKNLTTVLNKGNNELISEAILLLRNEQPFEGAIGLLISFYDKTDDFSIRNTIEGFMNDLKDQSAGAEVIKEIKKQWNPATTSMLISSCWQSGLDYSEYAFDITRMFLTGDYVIAIESMTVIGEFSNNISRKNKDEIMKIIEENPISPTNEKTGLVLELKSILEK